MVFSNINRKQTYQTNKGSLHLYQQSLTFRDITKKKLLLKRDISVGRHPVLEFSFQFLVPWNQFFQGQTNIFIKIDYMYNAYLSMWHITFNQWGIKKAIGSDDFAALFWKRKYLLIFLWNTFNKKRQKRSKNVIRAKSFGPPQGQENAKIPALGVRFSAWKFSILAKYWCLWRKCDTSSSYTTTRTGTGAMILTTKTE